MAEVSDEELTEAILLASRAMVGIAVRSLVGVTPFVTLSQFRSLVVMSYGGPSDLGRLAATLGVSPSTATRMCDRLVQKDFISRERVGSDRRLVSLAVTEKGRRVVRDVLERRQVEAKAMLGAIPSEARFSLVASLHLLADAVGEHPEMHWSRGWQDEPPPEEAGR